MKPHLPPEKCARAKRLYAQYGFKVAAEILGIPSSTMFRLLERGFEPAARKKRPVPNDFRIVAPGMSNAELCAHYATAAHIVARWRREAHIEGKRGGHTPKPIPADADMTIRRLGTEKAALHYGVHSGTITRWKRQLGIPLRNDKPESKYGWVDRYYQRKAAA